MLRYTLVAKFTLVLQQTSRWNTLARLKRLQLLNVKLLSSADMAKKKPVTLGEFKKVSGVGELKATWYGGVFVERIKDYLREHE